MHLLAQSRPRRSSSSSSSGTVTSASAALFALVALLLAAATVITPAAAQLQTGRDGCKGYDLSSSKYCSGFASVLYVPPNLTLALPFALVRNTSNPTDAEYLSQFKVDNLQSTDDFDKKVMENIILANIGDLNHRWFRCPLRKRGVKWSMTWYCNLLLNSQQFSCPKPSAPSPPSICRQSTDEAFQSAKANAFEDDCGLKNNPDAEKTFNRNLDTVYSSFAQFPRTNSSDAATCINAATIELPRNLCGFPTKETACANGCANTCSGSGAPGAGTGNNVGENTGAGNATGGTPVASSSSSTLAIVLGVLGGVVLLGGLGAAFVFYPRWRRNQANASRNMYMQWDGSQGGQPGMNGGAMGMNPNGGMHLNPTSALGYNNVGGGGIMPGSKPGSQLAYGMSPRGASDIDVPTVGRLDGLSLAVTPMAGFDAKPGSRPGTPLTASAPGSQVVGSVPSPHNGPVAVSPQLVLPAVTPLAIPDYLTSPTAPAATAAPGTAAMLAIPAAAAINAADQPLLRRPPSTKLSTVTPPPRTSFYENDDMESIAPEDSASNVGINPRYRPGMQFRPASHVFPGGSAGAPGLPPTAAAVVKSSPLAATAKADAAAAAAATEEARAAVANLPPVGRVVFPDFPGLPAHRVYHTYLPKLADELAIAPNDVVHVELVFTDGWAQGWKLDPVTGAKRTDMGVFPVAALEPQAPPPSAAASAAAAGTSPGAGSALLSQAQGVPLPASPAPGH
ncbi:hypothetical protein H9P43_009943 [Blastocladiella emersonii ATCC 22665]|nr:hypothetical protein H9P43_009943 [Blastocladiella emersonii ATCC 22665]